MKRKPESRWDWDVQYGRARRYAVWRLLFVAICFAFMLGSIIWALTQAI